MKRIALIDADFIMYTACWRIVNKDMGITPDQCVLTDSLKEEIKVRLLDQLDSIIAWIVVETECTHVRLAYSSLSPTFRYQVYELQEYKGGRPVKTEVLAYIESELRASTKYQHYTVEGLEADDLVSLWAEQCRNYNVDYVLVSADKDLKQVPGKYFAPKSGSVVETITPEKALWYRNMQLLTGDDTDKILGIPGMGPVKAEKLLKENDVDPIGAIYAAYQRHFGKKYGNIFFNETIDTVTMLTTHHRWYPDFKDQVYRTYEETHVIELAEVIPNPFL